MHRVLKRTLFAVAAIYAAIDAVWLSLVHFDIELYNYLAVAAAAPIFMAGSFFYSRKRHDEALSTLFAAAAFMVTFPPACNLLSYLLLTAAGPRIDVLLAHLDHDIGFDWVSLMAVAADHRALTTLLKYAYLSVIPQTLVLVFLLGWKKQLGEIYGFCLALAVGAAITLTIWALFPSFGAFSIFPLPDKVASGLGLALDTDYGAELTRMLQNGPGHISPAELRGIVGFPSYHTLQAVVLAWYARRLAFLRWPFLALNALVLIAVPIHGGHHLVDLFGGLAVSAVAIAIVSAIIAYAQRQEEVPLEWPLWLSGGMRGRPEPEAG
jgi:hypothetical protein